MAKTLATRTTQISISERALSVGTFGPFTSALLPASITQFIVELTPTPASWPASGEVLTLSIDESADGGTTWAFSASCSFNGGVQHDKQGNVMLTIPWVTTLMYTAGSRKIRLTATVVQACRAAATLSVE
jgi:hypothetical protein